MRTPTDEAERKAVSNIKKYGLHIIQVFADEQNPQFSYSIGLFENYLHPEIIIIGLRHELARILLNNMAHDIKNGKTFTAGEYHEGVLDNFVCYFGEVPQNQYQDNVGWATWFYEGKNFPLLQCVYPTVAGKFPWDKDFPEEVRFHCQLLIEPPKEH
jgi:hypothetical protein